MLGEGRARLSPALAAGNGSTWLSRRAPGHVGKAAQRVQPGARVQNPQPFPTGAPGHALGSPAAGAYVSGSGAFRRPHPQVPARERRLRSGGAVCNRSPGHPSPRASPARLQGRRLSRPALSRGLSGRRAGLRGRLSGSQPGGPRSRLINHL